MGWYVTIKTNPAVPEKVIEEIIENLPELVRGNYPTKQLWGWGLAIDVSYKLPELVLHASYSPYGTVMRELATESFCRRIENRGYEVTVEVME